MKTQLILLFAISVLVATISFSTKSAPISGTVEQVREQKAKVWEQFHDFINNLANEENFQDVLDLMREASADKQWIRAEIATMAQKLFDRICSDENLTDEKLATKLQALQEALPNLSETITRIAKNCKKIIALRKIHTSEIKAIIDEWGNYLQTAKNEMANLEKTKKEAQSSIEPLQQAVNEADLQNAASAFKIINKWAKASNRLNNALAEIAKKRSLPEWDEALTLGIPQLNQLENETAAVTTYAGKTVQLSNELMNAKNKAKDKAMKNAQDIEHKLQKARDKENQRHEAFKVKLAQETDNDMRAIMNKKEAELRSTADEAIEKLLTETNQWRKIAGQPPL